jgi:8-amino-3,8-dideoxy-alpha-D-manno-octulosonate transaminase
MNMKNTKPIRKKPLPPMYPGATMINKNEINAVLKVLKSQSLFRYYGPKFLSITSKFEETLAKYIGVKHALAVSSGTAALHCALTAIGIKPGDEVIIPAYAWVACPSTVVLCGGKPVVANINKTLTLDPKDVEAKITSKTKAIMAVHMRGMACDMDEIMEIAEKHNLIVIEDCAQADGGNYKGKKLGSMGNIGTFSFQLLKIITAGEGGAVVTNNKELYEKSVMFHDSGAIYRPQKFTIEPIAGTNYRITELQSAILLQQLKKIDKLIDKMRKNQEKIKKGISDIKDIEFREAPSQDADTGVCLVFYLPNAEKAREFDKALRTENIYTSSGGYPSPIYVPERNDGHVCIHWKHLLGSDFDETKYSESLELLGRAIHLDVSPLLSNKDIESIINGIHKVAEKVL